MATSQQQHLAMRKDLPFSREKSLGIKGNNSSDVEIVKTRKMPVRNDPNNRNMKSHELQQTQRSPVSIFNKKNSQTALRNKNKFRQSRNQRRRTAGATRLTTPLKTIDEVDSWMENNTITSGTSGLLCETDEDTDSGEQTTETNEGERNKLIDTIISIDSLISQTSSNNSKNDSTPSIESMSSTDAIAASTTYADINNYNNHYCRPLVASLFQSLKHAGPLAHPTKQYLFHKLSSGILLPKNNATSFCLIEGKEPHPKEEQRRHSLFMSHPKQLHKNRIQHTYLRIYDRNHTDYSLNKNKKINPTAIPSFAYFQCSNYGYSRRKRFLLLTNTMEPLALCLPICNKDGKYVLMYVIYGRYPFHHDRQANDDDKSNTTDNSIEHEKRTYYPWLRITSTKIVATTKTTMASERTDITSTSKNIHRPISKGRNGGTSAFLQIWNGKTFEDVSHGMSITKKPSQVREQQLLKQTQSSKEFDVTRIEITDPQTLSSTHQLQQQQHQNNAFSAVTATPTKNNLSALTSSTLSLAERQNQSNKNTDSWIVDVQPGVDPALMLCLTVVLDEML